MRTPPPVLPPDGSASAYKTTWLDRVGPDGVIALKATSYGIMVCALVTFAVVFTAAQVGKVSLMAIAGGFLAGAILGTLTARLALALASGAGTVARVVTAGGSSTPYEEQFSYQEALAARGDVAGALESYEAVLAERPGAVAPRMRAAELYAGRGRNPRRAAELFKEIRSLPEVPTREAVYASSRLADLYEGPLADPGRALVELRRLVEQYPATPMAARAREAIPRLKAKLLEERE